MQFKREKLPLSLKRTDDFFGRFKTLTEPIARMKKLLVSFVFPDGNLPSSKKLNFGSGGESRKTVRFVVSRKNKTIRSIWTNGRHQIRLK